VSPAFCLGGAELRLSQVKLYSYPPLQSSRSGPHSFGVRDSESRFGLLSDGTHSSAFSRLNGLRRNAHAHCAPKAALAAPHSKSDGPMLMHGLQECHHAHLAVVPTSNRLKPNKNFLEERYEMFRQAG
jgi:hypothetical protein